VTAAGIRVRPRRELRRQRRYRSHTCWNHLIAVPRPPWVPDALARGNTLRRRGCVHWVGRLADLLTARQRTIAVLGHERTGIPPEALDLLDTAVEIPMIGTGHSLNVAAGGSLVLYRLAGFL
jgi:tRNA (guanosine-2'-O-)-methyltransferase